MDTNGNVSLVGDIGATNARFALRRGEGEPLLDVRTLRCADYPGIVEAIGHYLDLAAGSRPDRAAIAIANPVSGDAVRMTNHPWSFSIEGARRQLGLDDLLVLNDFTALALALPDLPASDLTQVGGGAPVKGSPLAVIGPGTGLGVSGLIPSGTGWIPLETEGGHCSLSPQDARQADILRIAWREYEHVSTERLVSGIGLPNLYRAVAALNGVAAPGRSAEEIGTGASSGDQLCMEVMDTFCAMLGTAAANLALSIGARGGVYIGGGIVPKLGDFFVRSSFRRAFEHKGRFSDYLARIPVFVILAPYPALFGAARALAQSVPARR